MNLANQTINRLQVGYCLSYCYASERGLGSFFFFFLFFGCFLVFDNDGTNTPQLLLVTINFSSSCVFCFNHSAVVSFFFFSFLLLLLDSYTPFPNCGAAWVAYWLCFFFLVSFVTSRAQIVSLTLWVERGEGWWLHGEVFQCSHTHPKESGGRCLKVHIYIYIYVLFVSFVGGDT